jgi:hypothetical protein
VVVAVGQQARRLETGFLGEPVVPVVVEAVVLVGPERLAVVEVARMGQRRETQAGQAPLAVQQAANLEVW